MTPRARGLVLIGLISFVAVSTLVALLMFAVGGRGEGPARTGVPVSAEDQALIVEAARACPALTPARLAGQIMANSGFDPTSTVRPGRSGLAGLTDGQWQRWAPGPSADRNGRADQITALSRLMCDLVGRVRSIQSTVDEWRLAVAAFLVGVDDVTSAGGVPGGAAADYVATVVGYTRWYESQPAFTATAAPTSAAGESQSTTPSPVPSSQPPTSVPTTNPAQPPTTSRSSPRPTLAPGARDAYGRIEAEHYSDGHGTAVEDCFDTGGGRSVGYLAPGDWLRYDRVDFGSTPATRVALRYAGKLPESMTATVYVRLDSPQAQPIGEVTMASTGGWQAWVTVGNRLTPTTGVHDVYLTFSSSNGWEIGNLNWFTFGR